MFLEHSKYKWIRLKALDFEVPVNGPKTLDQIIRKLPIHERYTVTFYISQELWGIDFQTNTEDFQLHGNKFANDTCNKWEFSSRFVLWEEWLSDFTKCLTSFSGSSEPKNVYKVEFTNISSGHRIGVKLRKCSFYWLSNRIWFMAIY